MLISESEIRVSKKNLKKYKKPKKAIFVRCIPAVNLLHIKLKYFFRIQHHRITQKKIVLNAKFNQAKNRSKFGLFDPTYDH